MHRDKLGHLTVDPPGYKVAPCGHALQLDFNMDERCAFCLDYEEAAMYDAQAARDELYRVTVCGDVPRAHVAAHRP